RQGRAGSLGGGGAAGESVVRTGRGQRGSGAGMFRPCGVQAAGESAADRPPRECVGQAFELTRFEKSQPGKADVRKTIMSKASELREKSTEQLEFSLHEEQTQLFQLRFQSATEKLDAPSNLRKHRREIARIKTILRQRELAGQK